MALIEIEDLPAQSADVLRRRARAAGMAVTDYLRAELIARARTRVPDDAVVDFLRSQGRELGCEWDADAAALADTYDLPADALDRFGCRAGAAGVSLAEYVRGQLISMARRTSVDDALEEFREAMRRDPGLAMDLEAIAADIRYARGL
ncbi:hypothetical protein [Nocardia bovistercoris]|uniref:Uncharacterized protein n=1 Tax=Nocardia bovistercoris TaxID=2785916 RepID=A0A931N797_9NOCA|nr:hypothetical protein [Nocardia bovistercoris]MBH0781371.1 hypothetical protein [Nocardia bovistercoris]